MGRDETMFHTIGVGRRLRRPVKWPEPRPVWRPEGQQWPGVNPRPRRSDGGSDGPPSQPHQGTGARSHATSTQIARNATRGEILDRRLAVDGLPVLSLSSSGADRRMASAKKGQQARSEIGYPGHVERRGSRPTNSVTVNPHLADHEGVHDWIMNPPSSRFIRPSPIRGAGRADQSRPSRVDHH